MEYFLQLPKTYLAEITLGQETDTLDNTGTAVSEKPVSALTMADLNRATARFSGEIMQTPPIFSNVRVDGRRAHELTREGKEATMKPRKAVIHDLCLLTHSTNRLTMRCQVSSGTYIRALARDIAQELGTVGHLSVLRRTKIGLFDVPDLANSYSNPAGTVTQQLVDNLALEFIEPMEISPDEARRFCQGQRIPVVVTTTAGLKRVMSDGQLVGIAATDGRVLRVAKIYPN